VWINCGGLLKKITKQGKQEFSHDLRIIGIFIAPFFTKESCLSCKIYLGYKNKYQSKILGRYGGLPPLRGEAEKPKALERGGETSPLLN